MGFSRQEYWSGLPFASAGTFPTQGLNPGLQHCRQIFYRLSHQGRILRAGQSDAFLTIRGVGISGKQGPEALISSRFQLLPSPRWISEMVDSALISAEESSTPERSSRPFQTQRVERCGRHDVCGPPRGVQGSGPPTARRHKHLIFPSVDSSLFWAVDGPWGQPCNFQAEGVWRQLLGRDHRERQSQCPEGSQPPADVVAGRPSRAKHSGWRAACWQNRPAEQGEAEP